MLLCSMTLDMLLSLGLQYDFYCRYVAGEKVSLGLKGGDAEPAHRFP